MAVTIEDLTNAGIAVSGDGLYELSAVEWIGSNTSIPVSAPADIAALSSSARLFIKEYASIMKRPYGVTNESIEGLSHSFDGRDKNTFIMNLARSLLGSAVNSGFKFIPPGRTWRYGC